MRHPGWFLAALFATSSIAVIPDGTGFAAEPLERLTAFAVDMSNQAGRTRAGTVDIVIERWSTPQELAQLTAALQESGPDGLLKTLQKIKKPAGYIRRTGSLGYPLRFATQVEGESGGRRILIATDRPIGFLEARNQRRTLDYPFMCIDIRLGPNGKGEGKLMPVAKITANSSHVVEIENYASEPVRLTEVHKVS